MSITGSGGAGLTGQITGALDRAATLALSAKTDLEAQLSQLSAQMAPDTNRWDGVGARAFDQTYAGWADQQLKVVAALQWFHDQLRAIEALNSATDAAQAHLMGIATGGDAA